MNTPFDYVLLAGFWLGIAVLAYVYVGYPATLLLFRARRTAATADKQLPTVAVIIAAYNEVRHIAHTVRNKLAQHYPASHLRVIVVSDGSTDGTDAAVAELGEPRVTLLRQDPRQGKTLALNRGVAASSADILVFSDANSHYELNTVSRLVESFQDPAVGYATGNLTYEDPGDTAVGGGSGLYMKYENWVRRLETRAGSVVGVNGGVDAVRRALYRPMRADQLPDFVLPLQVVQQGFRTVYCEHAHAREQALGRDADEFRMRVRVALRALNAISDMRGLLSVRFGLFAFQLFVHKVLRYLVSIPLALAFLCNLGLLDRPFYRATFALQVLCYVLAGIGWASRGRIRWRVVFVPFYFCLVNAAATAAFVGYLRGNRPVMWTPRKGA